MIPDVGLRWFMSNLSLSMPSSPILIDAHFKQRYSDKSVVRASRGEVIDVVINNLGESSGLILFASLLFEAIDFACV